VRRLVAVVVNYRTPELTTQALASLETQLDPARDAAVVVDNASEDGSADRIQAWIDAGSRSPWIRLLRAERNGGFAAACNLAIRSAPAAHYLLLNSDAQLRPEAAARLLETAQRHPSAGLIGASLESPEGELQSSCFRFHSPLGELIDAAGSGPVTRLLSRWNVPLPPHPDVRDVDWTSFACVLVAGKLLDRVGLLDEGYFLYYEDVDLCRRAREGGWRVLCDGRARAVHEQGGSSVVPEALRTRARPPAYLYHSRARYFTGYYGRSGFWLANVLWHVGRLLSLSRQLLGGGPRPACEAQWRDIWRTGRREARTGAPPATVS